MLDSVTPGGPLAGVKVLDLSRFIAGPLCAQILGDFGAEVLKVERPSGEDSRHHAPYYRGESLYTMLYNRNKRGVTLDTRHPDSPPILRSLIEWADVVVENYRPGTLQMMGIGFERMQELNPSVILVSISGFGQTGPESKRGLFDAIAQAASGLMSVTGDPEGPPTLTGTYIADYTTGFQGAIGALAAVMHKNQTGEGQLVDVASLDATFSILGTRLISHLMLGTDLPRSGSRDLLTAPVNVFSASDTPVYIQAGTDSLFQKLCKALDRIDLLEDQVFSTVKGRMANQSFLEGVIAAWAAERTADEIAEVLEEAGIPYAKVASVSDISGSAQIEHREMISEIEHPVIGSLKIPNSPIKMGKSPPTIRRAPPLLGEHSDEVYSQILGMSTEAIADLRERGAI